MYNVEDKEDTMKLFGDKYPEKPNWVMCPICFWSGKIKCPSCEGTGREYPGVPDSRPCSTCNGKGKVPCWNCAGFGKIKKQYEIYPGC